MFSANRLSILKYLFCIIGDNRYSIIVSGENRYLVSSITNPVFILDLLLDQLPYTIPVFLLEIREPVDLRKV